MTQIFIDRLLEIPYINANFAAGRFLSCLTFYEEDWHFWIVAGDGSEEKLIKIKAWPAEALYFSRHSVKAEDIYLPFVDFIGRVTSFSALQKPFTGICDDILNLSASLAKLIHLQGAQDRIPHGLSRMATTEVEYVILVCRSLFDLFQEIIVHLWNSTELIDKTVRKKRLKASFAQTMLVGDKLLSCEELAERFGMPEEIAQCYGRAAEVFIALRRFRDNIVHHGSQMQHVFDGNGCFLIKTQLNLFPNMVMWTDDERQPNDLVPLVPAIETVIYRTIDVLNDFCVSLYRHIQFPPPVVPEMQLFMRGYFIEFLVAALESGARRSAVQP